MGNSKLATFVNADMLLLLSMYTAEQALTLSSAQRYTEAGVYFLISILAVSLRSYFRGHYGEDKMTVDTPYKEDTTTTTVVTSTPEPNIKTKTRTFTDPKTPTVNEVSE